MLETIHVDRLALNERSLSFLCLRLLLCGPLCILITRGIYTTNMREIYINDDIIIAN